MEVQSAFSSGLQGFQKAQTDAYQAAENIVANVQTQAEDSVTPQESKTATAEKNSSYGDAPELNQSIVDLKVAEFQGKASANIIQTADEVLGTLLDVRA